MQQKINALMEQYEVSFTLLSEILGVSKQTLTKKVTGEMDWTFPEMEKLIELFQIKDPQNFFFE